MSWNVIEILKVTEEYFKKKGIDTARLDAEILLAHLLDMDRMKLYLNFDRPLTEGEVNSYRELVRRRSKREPVAYIVGCKEFYGHSFKVTPDVLIPRPETETLVDVAREEIENFIEARKKFPNVLELGTGSGCIVISLALLFPEIEFRATDISEKILTIAKENAEKLGAKNIVFKESNLCGVCQKNFFDFIVFNPPYISPEEFDKLQPELKFEPKEALVAPEGGNYFYRRLLEEGKEYVREEGKLIIEVGSWTQKLYVEEKAKKEGWGEVNFKKDLSGFPRVAVIKNLS